MLDTGFDLNHLFQFQYGSIISVIRYLVAASIRIFQFQYGSIISRRNTAEHTFVDDFNSNMVQL